MSAPHILEASFLVSATGPEEGAGWPKPGAPEIGFVGRSNVGKSSLLTALLKRRGLVRISKTPGRTRLINFFTVKILDDSVQRELLFVDLPGFGYAKVSQTERASWQGFMEQYLGGRESLRAVLLLFDARRGPQSEEIELAAWLHGRGVRVIPIITKADELPKHKRKLAAIEGQTALRAALGGKCPMPLLTSTSLPVGIEELLAKIVRLAASETGADSGKVPA